MRLIDGNKLLETYKKWIPQLLSKEDEGDRRGVETCIMVLEDMQTVDALPVVRCRECKNKNKKKCPMTIVNFGRNGKEILVQNHVPDDFYCAYGERKGGADNDT